MVSVVASKMMTYAGKNYDAGEEFDCSERDAKVLTAIRKASYSSGSGKKIERKVLVAKPEPVVEPTPEPVVEPTPEPVVEPTPEPVVEPVAEAPIEDSTSSKKKKS